VNTIIPYVYEPQLRTVRLRAAVAVGAAAVAGAFGAGFVLAQTLDEPARATASAEGQTFDSALAESILLKQRVPVGGKADDIRFKRVER
jgi:hypothetical protein